MPADSYTPILGLILQGTGNNDNTWGENLNSFVIEYIEDAIAGAAAFTVTSGDVTLTDAQARMAILNVTGTLTGNRNIIVPNLTKRWIVYNNTSGSYTLGIKTTSGSAITLPQSGWCEVWCDGSNGMYMSPSTVKHYAQTDGTFALPYFSFASDPDSGMYRIGANNLGLAVNGANVLDISTTGLGVTGTVDASDDVSTDGLFLQGGVTVIPIGATLEYDGLTAPNGWLFKYGQAVSRTTYSDLFSALTATATATRSDGSTGLTSVGTDFSALGVVGAYIEGTGISLGTTITAVTATTITLSAAASGNGSITIRILPHGQGDGSTTFNIPNDQDVVKAGRSNMGGTSRNLLTGLSGGINGDKLGSFGGAESHTLTEAQLPTISENIPAQQITFGYNTATIEKGTGSSGSQTAVTTVGSGGSTATCTDDASPGSITFGSGEAHNNVQPTRITNYIIFTGVFS